MASSILSIQTFAAPSLSSTLSSSLSSFSKGSPLSIPPSCFSSNTNTNHSFAHRAISLRPLAKASLLSSFSFPFLKKVDRNSLKEELLDAIATLDRGAYASPEDEFRVDKIARELESVNPTKDPLKSPLLNGKWELLYTTSASILKKKTLKILRPSGPIYQAINADTLRAQNMETWPYFSQVTANLTPLSGRKVAVKFDVFKVAGLISIKAPDTARGELEITYLDEELRISRGDKGNLFILKMVDSTYRVPL